MAPQRLQSIRIKGYSSIRSTKVELRDLNVLIGANGAGKSNFISVLALLGRIVDEELNLFVGQAGGASALLYRGGESVPEIALRLEFAFGEYWARLIPAARDELIFGNEGIELRGERHVLGRGHRETRLLDEIDERDLSSVARHVVDTLRGCRVFHFHDTSANAPVKQTGFASDNIALHPDARNLAAILLRLQQEDHAAYRRIVRTIQQVAPFFRDFVLIEENGRLRLRWQQEASDVVFPADALSDGTLRFICLTTLLSLPDLPNLVVLDEPELGLHPYAIIQLADMLRAASSASQVLIATQSVTLMNQFEVDDLIVVERDRGASVFNRLDPAVLTDWLAEYSLGELWEKNLLGGRPQAEPR
ncbi:chromosome segregation protein SMC [Sphaerisporangium siamense]|uniref:Putative ATPase n=1 Tax=Sphaerisporangium siamense TaxID=795645 RepID=A0A7W7D1I1_9ACTN|nr:AAA family ATPase [Sphaerisporangium siamense]MBB4698563.1 putative ATPase [Sphaerisporangium siamense]GII85377.1 chromosome segregation protein SMC [Sphaerisporangium siamense]